MDFGINNESPIAVLREQLQMLLRSVRNGFIDVRRAKTPLSVLLTDFGVNQALITPTHAQNIMDLSSMLAAYPALEVEIFIGRASQTGNETNNQSLSEARALAALEEFGASIYPVPPTMGLGSTQPFQDIPGVEVELNRSVEIKLWYDLSYHFVDDDPPSWTDKSPEVFWRDYSPGSRYDRAAQALGLVYDNINDLYLPQHDVATGVMNALTAWQDDDMVRTRQLIGYYKQTGSDAQAIASDIANFNKLLRDNGLTPNDFTGEEISDAEHFATAAVSTMIPIVGFALGPAFSFGWDGTQGVYGSVMSGNTDSLEYNMQQVIGSDMAGVAYGMMRAAKLYQP